jgi:hypothetical protein
VVGLLFCLVCRFDSVLRSKSRFAYRRYHVAQRSYPVIPTIKGRLSHCDQTSFRFPSDSGLRCLLRKPNLVSPLANVSFRQSKKTRTCLTEIKSSFLVILISPTKKRLIIRDYRL